MPKYNCEQTELERKRDIVKSRFRWDVSDSNKYLNGIIYGIYDVKNDELLYIGSTANMKQRIVGHLNGSKNKSSRLYTYIRDEKIDWEMKTIEEYPSPSKGYLEQREYEFIEKKRPRCNVLRRSIATSDSGRHTTCLDKHDCQMLVAHCIVCDFIFRFIHHACSDDAGADNTFNLLTCLKARIFTQSRRIEFPDGEYNTEHPESSDFYRVPRRATDEFVLLRPIFSAIKGNFATGTAYWTTLSKHIYGYHLEEDVFTMERIILGKRACPKRKNNNACITRVVLVQREIFDRILSFSPLYPPRSSSPSPLPSPTSK